MDWQRVVVPRLQLKTRIDGNLHRTFKGGEAIQGKENSEVTLLDAEFADDLMIFADNEIDLHVLLTSLFTKLKAWGFEMSDKTELLTFGGEPTNINVGPFIVKEADDTTKGGHLAGPGNFKYVGSTFSNNCEIFREIELRIRSGWAAFAKFKQAVWNVNQLQAKVKGQIWLAAVLPAVHYGLGARAVAPRHIKKLQSFQDGCARQILQVSRQQQHNEHITNEALRTRLGWKSMEYYCATEILRHVGHIMRMDNKRLPKQCLFAWHPDRETKPPVTGGFHQRYTHSILWALKMKKIPQKIWFVLASDASDEGKRKWRKIIKEGFQGEYPHEGPPQEDPANKIIDCPECGVPFKMIALPLHYLKKHKEDLGGESWDAWCERHNIQRRPTARRNDRASAASLMIASPGGRFHCDEPGCFEAFNSRKALTAHKLSHIVRTAHDIIHCEFCGHPCKGPGGLSKHIELKHPQGTFRDRVLKCSWPQCAHLTFPLQMSLTKHINTKHDGHRTEEEAAQAAPRMRPAAAAAVAAPVVRRRPAAAAAVANIVRRRPASANNPRMLRRPARASST